VKRLSATEVLVRHARERWLRRAIRSVPLDGQLGAVERLSESAWVDSCQLTAGVPAVLLDVLGVRECEGTGEQKWNCEQAEHMGITYERETERWTPRLTLEQAATRLGLEIDHQALRSMRFAAIATVTENLLRRQARNGVAA